MNILVVCVWETEVGYSWGRTTLGTCDLCTCYNLYCVFVITSGCNRGAAGEVGADVDALREHQLMQAQ